MKSINNYNTYESYTKKVTAHFHHLGKVCGYENHTMAYLYCVMLVEMAVFTKITFERILFAVELCPEHNLFTTHGGSFSCRGYTG